MRTLLDVCSGIGGFSLAMKHLVGGFRTVGYIEIDPYCQEVLKQRIRDGHLDDAPIFSDLRKFDGQPYRGKVDCLTSGFPCQPFSIAGKQLGEADPRNLWPDIARLIREVRPGYVFLENVTALLSNGYFGRVLGDLAESGYGVRWDCIPASSVGAPHRRDRLWIVANRDQGTVLEENTKGCGLEQNPLDVVRRNEGSNRLRAVCEEVADAERAGLEGKPERQARSVQPAERSWWLTEPAVGRVANGVSDRVGKLRALGNSVVPAVVAKAWDTLT